MSILINNFTKGWVNKPRHSMLTDGALYVCKDLELDTTGEVRCRDLHQENKYFDTFSPFSSTAPTDAIRNVYAVNVEGVNKYLLYYQVGESLYRYNSVTNATVDIGTFTEDRRISYAAIKPKLSTYTYVYITNGVTLLADNGTTTKTWGIDAPTGACITADAGLTGRLDAGVYSYRYTFYDQATGSESDPSPVSNAYTSTADGSALLTNIGTSADSRVTHRRVYRTIADGGSYFLAAIIPDNTTRTHTDLLADTGLTTKLVTDQGLPPSGDVVTQWNNYLFMSGDTDFLNRVYFSMLSLPDNWPSTYYIDVGTTGDVVQSIIKVEEKLFFVTTTTVIGLIGGTVDTFKGVETKATVGTYARWSCATNGDVLFFLARDGIYMFDGSAVVNIASDIDKLFRNTPTELYEVIDTDLAEAEARGVCYQGRYYLRVPLRDGDGATSYKVLVYEITDKRWTQRGYDPGDMWPDVKRGILYGGLVDSSSGVDRYKLRELESADSVSSSAVDTPSPEFVTKAHDITSAPLQPVKAAEFNFGVRESRIDEIAYVKEFRVDGKGSWSFEFYLDDVLRHSVTLNGLNSGNAYIWRNLPMKLKGRFMYIKATASGTLQPNDCYIREIEVR
jgi:hypothetical protein